jgi:hypothetical protein
MPPSASGHFALALGALPKRSTGIKEDVSGKFCQAAAYPRM